MERRVVCFPQRQPPVSPCPRPCFFRLVLLLALALTVIACMGCSGSPLHDAAEAHREGVRPIRPVMHEKLGDASTGEQPSLSAVRERGGASSGSIQTAGAALDR